MWLMNVFEMTQNGDIFQTVMHFYLQVIDFCCAKDGMARSKLPSIAPHKGAELRKMIAQMKENVEQDIVDLEDAKRKFSNAFVEEMMKELEKVIPEVFFVSCRCP
ncbi:hypothetical protein DdX_05768 [Ditylenchus destructor]|uniref:Uncharacterized protein n=1 Tax=Ditylenchus destructor TaxID=166010 RepID=A0AAD4NB99_9BILA|nr:hypothetical protein DdX_05768 [Ditylenchus destructor]